MRELNGAEERGSVYVDAAVVRGMIDGKGVDSFRDNAEYENVLNAFDNGERKVVKGSIEEVFEKLKNAELYEG